MSSSVGRLRVECAWFETVSRRVKIARCLRASPGLVRAITKMSSRVRTL